LSTTPPPPPPIVASVIPLSPAVRAAYQALSNTYEDAFDANPDLPFRKELMAWQTDVNNILTKDDEYKFNRNTALYEALLIQINATNTDLVTIKGEIAAIAGKIAMAGDIIAAINKVLTLFPIA
jgi:hypothetical protein